MNVDKARRAVVLFSGTRGKRGMDASVMDEDGCVNPATRARADAPPPPPPPAVGVPGHLGRHGRLLPHPVLPGAQIEGAQDDVEHESMQANCTQRLRRRSPRASLACPPLLVSSQLPGFPPAHLAAQPPLPACLVFLTHYPDASSPLDFPVLPSYSRALPFVVPACTASGTGLCVARLVQRQQRWCPARLTGRRWRRWGQEGIARAMQQHALISFVAAYHSSSKPPDRCECCQLLLRMQQTTSAPSIPCASHPAQLPHLENDVQRHASGHACSHGAACPAAGAGMQHISLWLLAQVTVLLVQHVERRRQQLVREGHSSDVSAALRSVLQVCTVSTLLWCPADAAAALLA